MQVVVLFMYNTDVCVNILLDRLCVAVFVLFGFLGENARVDGGIAASGEAHADCAARCFVRSSNFEVSLSLSLFVCIHPRLCDRSFVYSPSKLFIHSRLA